MERWKDVQNVGQNIYSDLHNEAPHRHTRHISFGHHFVNSETLHKLDKSNYFLTEINQLAVNIKIALQALKDYFGYPSFRPMQQDIIQAIYDKKDALVLMPTGGGKSMCYQIPAITLPGVCVVVSPLIALMKDQVEGLRANGINATFLNSSQTMREQNDIESELLTGRVKLLYVSPEKMVSQSFIPLLKKLPLNLLAIDEAHCISSWGHDFRPEYTQLSFLKRQFPHTPVIALTATADKTTRKDILKQLGLPNPVVFTSSFDRPNLSLSVLPARKRIEFIISYIKRRPNQSGIVYCMSRKSTEAVAQKLKAQNIKAEAYHAGLPNEERARIQEDFVNDKTPIIAATVAFGMGIDKSNIRWIIHYNMPRNIEAYYQEIGRAGRDGVDSDTILFYSYADVMFWQKIIEESPYRSIKIAKLDRMKELAESLICRRKVLLSYFGEHLSENCGNCDVCLNPPKEFDGTVIAQKALSALSRLERGKQYVGLSMLIDILRGSRRQEIIQNNYHKIKTYGAGGNHSYNDWQYFLQQLLNLGLIEIAYDENSVLKKTEASKGVLFEGQKVNLVSRDFALNRQKAKKKEADARPSSQKEQAKEGLFEQLRQLRLQIARETEKAPYLIFSDATLKDMVGALPINDDELLQVSGVGKAKLATYGAAFLKAIREFIVAQHAKGVKLITGQSLLVTHHYYLEGETPEAIAEKRSLSITTIYGHIADLYLKGEKIRLGKYITKKEVTMVLDKLRATNQTEPPFAMKPIFDALNEEVPYYKIKLALAYFQRNK